MLDKNIDIETLIGMLFKEIEELRCEIDRLRSEVAAKEVAIKWEPLLPNSPEPSPTWPWNPSPWLTGTPITCGDSSGGPKS